MMLIPWDVEISPGTVNPLGSPLRNSMPNRATEYIKTYDQKTWPSNLFLRSMKIRTRKMMKSIAEEMSCVG